MIIINSGLEDAATGANRPVSLCVVINFIWSMVLACVGCCGWLVVAEEPAEIRAHDCAISEVSGERIDLDRVGQWLEKLSPAAIRGYRHLLESVYLPPDFDEDVFDELAHKLESRPQAIESTEKGRTRETARQKLLHFYGLTERPGEETAQPLQYVVQKTQFAMNCFSCHGGSVYGQALPGAPNNRYALQTLIEDVREAKLKLGKPLGHMDIGSMFMPLGSTVGTTNAVMFGVALMNYRDAELNIHTLRPGPKMVHHDMDPPAWWLMHRKTRLYADGFAQKGHRGLMQFMLVRQNGPEKFRQWEDDFRDILAFMEALRPPKYPYQIDADLAERGRAVFSDNCSHCHGTYGQDSDFPERLIPIEEIGTDRVRLESLSARHRDNYGKSWFTGFGEQDTWTDPGGYIAPPLDGIWASPPYFHNGSVPTLWHVLNPELRPTVWRRVSEKMDQQRIGLSVREFGAVPSEIEDAHQRRQYFDTRAFGKSPAGHDFPAILSSDQRRAVLEYLKTL